MRKLAGVLFILILIVGCASNGNVVKSEKIVKIGFMAPLTGPVSDLGVPVLNSAQLAVKRLNDAGGVNGKHVELVVEDSKCSGKEAATIATKFVNFDNVDVIVAGVCSSDVLGAAPIVEAAHKILISGIAASPEITNAGDYIFRLSASSTIGAKAAAQMIYDAGYRKVSVLYENNDYPLGFYKEFRTNFEKFGGKVVLADSIEMGSTDFKTHIMKVEESDSEALMFIPISYSAAGLFFKQIKEFGLDLPVFSQDSSSVKAVSNIAGDALDGIRIIVYDFDLDSQEMVQFVDSYSAEYGECDNCYGGVQDIFYTALSFDTINLVADGLNVCEDSECLKDFLNNVDGWKGAAGSVTMDQNGDTVRQFTVVQYHGSKLGKVE